MMMMIVGDWNGAGGGLLVIFGAQGASRCIERQATGTRVDARWNKRRSAKIGNAKTITTRATILAGLTAEDIERSVCKRLDDLP
jgi:hypothetical protein